MRRVWFILVLLLAFSVSAQNFEVDISPSQKSVKADQSAEFQIELQHSTPFEEVFEIYSTDVIWDVRLEKPLRALPGVPIKSKVYIRPLNVNPGLYTIALNFRQMGTSDIVKRLVQIEVQSPFPPAAEYLPAIRGVVEVVPRVDPRQGLTIKLHLENQNKRTLQRVDAKIRSNVINKDYTTALGPEEKKTLTFTADLDPRTKPQEDVLYITLIVPEQEKAYQFDLLPVTFEVIPYGGVVPVIDRESSFLKHTDTVRFTNEGNRAITHLYRVPAFFMKKWLISSDQLPSSDPGELVWEVQLEPGASAKIVILYNYRPVFWTILIALIILISYFMFRSPLVVKKRAIVLSTEEDGTSKLKVVVEVMNRTNKVVRHVRIMDLVPRLADYVKSGAMMKPSKVVPHPVRGTLVRWELNTIDVKEHRIFTYQLKSKLQVLGSMQLPVAAVRFKAAGSEREIVSNKPDIKLRS